MEEAQYPREQSCCFTGHRTIPMAELRTVRARLEETVRALCREGITHFIAGGALGFDTMAAETVVRLRSELPALTLTLALPCRDQGARWSLDDKRRYQSLIDTADQVVCLSEEYTPMCMQRRNRYMVDHSCCCIFYLTRTRSGTGMTVKYAAGQDLRLMNILG